MRFPVSSTSRFRSIFPPLTVFLLFFFLAVSCGRESRPFFTGNRPNARLTFDNLSPGAITKETTRVLARAGRAFTNIKSVPDDRCGLGSTVIALDDLLHEIWKFGGPLYLMGYVHPDKAVRKAALDSVNRLERFTNGVFLDRALYSVFLRFSKTPAAKALRGEYRKALDDTIRGMRQSGLGLPDDKLARVRKIRNRLMKLGMEYSKNIRDSKGSILIRKGPETAGLSARYLKSREVKPGQYRIDLTYPSFFPFLKNSKWAEGRKRLYTLYQSRAKNKNLTLLKQVLQTRRKLVGLLGYPNYAAYVLEERMAKKSAHVWDFLRKLRARLAPFRDRDLALLTGLKREETGDPKAVLEVWDVFYYAARAREKLFKLDMEKVREYFPVPEVIRGLFSISQRLFGLDFRQVENASVWHKDVLLYEAFDSKSGRLIGRFYLDLYPRPGKYGHAAMFTMVNGKLLSGGVAQRPTFTLVCNFPRGDGKSPGLLSFNEVETFFHEFGHGLHGLLSETKLQMFSGTEVARDFVEMPSQFFENWIYQPAVLRQFARHYSTRKPIPDSMINSLIRSRTFLAGYNNTKQIFYAAYDMTLNDGFDPEKSTTDLYRTMHDRYTGVKFIKGTVPEASFGHLIGYAAGYYGYLWAKVYAQDVFSPFVEKGPDPVLGRKLRRTIFSRGGSEDPMNLLKAFLGRSPRDDAFLRSLGLSVGGR